MTPIEKVILWGIAIPLALLLWTGTLSAVQDLVCSAAGLPINLCVI